MHTNHTKPAHNFIDLTGQRFGRLVVIVRVPRPSHIKPNKRVYWSCQCDCGGTEIVSTSDLRTSHIRSCGCLRNELSASRRTTHGKRHTPEYRSWHHMIERCHNPTSRDYSLYGARGIEVCQRWRDSFSTFFADMGPRPTLKHSIDRIDNERGYSPDNCRWALSKVQANNTRRNRLITYNERTQTMQEWAREVGIERITLEQRLHSGWSIERTLTTPVRPHKQHPKR